MENIESVQAAPVKKEFVELLIAGLLLVLALGGLAM
jgi:hypothetical protein